MSEELKLKKAAEILKKAGIVIFPTDTAFAIGCRIDNKEAIERLFKIKKRPQNQPVPVLVNSLEMAKNYWQELSKEVLGLIKKYWPGALTIIYPAKTEKVYPLILGGQGNLGLRMPNHSLTLTLIKSLAMPILGPSANFHNKKTPYNFTDLDRELVKKADYVLDGICPLKQASTVIDCSKKPYYIIRQGPVKIN